MKLAYHTFYRNWWGVTTSEILDELGIHGKLRTLLTVHWGYYGTNPDESSFAMHALVLNHYYWGAFYPKGGSKRFCETFMENVIENGGHVICQAKVKELIYHGNSAIGVRLVTGEEYFAHVIVSAAGARRTIRSLLPEKWQTSSWGSKIM